MRNEHVYFGVDCCLYGFAGGVDAQGDFFDVVFAVEDYAFVFGCAEICYYVFCATMDVVQSVEKYFES